MVECLINQACRIHELNVVGVRLHEINKYQSLQHSIIVTIMATSCLFVNFLKYLLVGSGHSLRSLPHHIIVQGVGEYDPHITSRWYIISEVERHSIL